MNPLDKVRVCEAVFIINDEFRVTGLSNRINQLQRFFDIILQILITGDLVCQDVAFPHFFNQPGNVIGVNNLSFLVLYFHKSLTLLVGEPTRLAVAVSPLLS